MYKVYYLSTYQRSFPTRDEAMDYILFEIGGQFDRFGNYEILDGSDFL